jgi:acyl dehydratase
VPVGSRVRLKQKLLKVEPRAGGKQMTFESVVEIEGQERPALVAETMSVTYGA